MNITEEFNNYKEEDNMPYFFHNFYEDSWDYVSNEIVSDEYFFKNETFIRELTFDLHNLYSKSNKLIASETRLFYAKEAGKILEIIFSNLNKHKKM